MMRLTTSSSMRRAGEERWIETTSEQGVSNDEEAKGSFCARVL